MPSKSRPRLRARARSRVTRASRCPPNRDRLGSSAGNTSRCHKSISMPSKSRRCATSNACNEFEVTRASRCPPNRDGAICQPRVRRSTSRVTRASRCPPNRDKVAEERKKRRELVSQGHLDALQIETHAFRVSTLPRASASQGHLDALQIETALDRDDLLAPLHGGHKGISTPYESRRRAPRRQTTHSQSLSNARATPYNSRHQSVPHRRVSVCHGGP